jgi:hypothetical protein
MGLGTCTRTLYNQRRYLLGQAHELTGGGGGRFHRHGTLGLQGGAPRRALLPQLLHFRLPPTQLLLCVGRGVAGRDATDGL